MCKSNKKLVLIDLDGILKYLSREFW